MSEIADAEHRAEAVAGLFLAAYLGLAGPVSGLGALIQITSPRLRMLVFAPVLTAGVLAATPTLPGRKYVRSVRRARG